ncbi:MAG: hypothetical protein GYA45_11580 [Pelolinea sp.]|nr:hypothetical protein [Pelolinea sp.]
MKNIDDPHTNPIFEYSVQRNVLHEKPNSPFIQATYQTNLGTLVSNHPNATIYAMGVLNATSGGGAGETRTTINGRISAAATAVGSPVVYVDTTGWIDPATDTSDGVHPTAAGQLKIRDAMIALLPA